VWVVEIIQDPGYEGPTEITRVPSSHVGCERASFHVGAHTLTIDIEDIYFLTGLSRQGSR
jgi:hypothetical protein